MRGRLRSGLEGQERQGEDERAGKRRAAATCNYSDQLNPLQGGRKEGREPPSNPQLPRRQEAGLGPWAQGKRLGGWAVEGGG